MECSGPSQEVSLFDFNSGAVTDSSEEGAYKSQLARKPQVMTEPHIGVKGSEVLSKTLSDRLIDGSTIGPLALSHNYDHAKCFNEVVRKIKSSKQKIILERISGVTSEQIGKIVQCCDNPALILNHYRCFFTSDEFPYVNLRAFRDGIIDINAFATLASLQGIFLENSVQNESFEMKYTALFHQNGEPDKEAWKAIEETLQKSNDEKRTVFKPEFVS